MVQINDNYLNLEASYLFPEIGRKVREFSTANPQAKIIRLGIGDVVLALPPSVVKALHAGVDEMADPSTFRGYGPEQGYDFLREAIVANDYAKTDISADEVFISDGSKCDCSNIQEIFGKDCTVAVSDPVYPVYVDSNVMAGRTGSRSNGRYAGIVYMPLNEANGFAPEIPDKHVDLIYLCSPNNPTGEVLSRSRLSEWVEYARKHSAVILFDAAYERYITDPDIPRSIFEIEGARECAIEFRSFSKTAGFTGLRCAFTVVPKELSGRSSSGQVVNIRQLWLRRHTTKFNGVAYPVQRAAAAIYSDLGRREITANIEYYLENARVIRNGLQEIGMEVYGGINAPYVWLKTPVPSSWSFFDLLLSKCNVVGTPGAGFGPAGEGYFRLSAFGHAATIAEALERIRKL